MNEICPNCQQQVMGKFCHHCGQPAEVHRLTIQSFLTDLQQRIFGFDNKFAHTIRDLTLRPGEVITQAIRGIKVTYVGPLGYYFVLLTVFTLLISILDIDMEAFTSGVQNAFNPQPTENITGMQHTLNGYIYGNFRLFSFIMLPFFITATWLVFKRKRYNYMESAALVFYAMGHPMILSIISVLLFQFFQVRGGVAVMAVISYFYFAFVCSDFYPGNKIWNFVKGLLSVLAGYLFLILASIIISLIVFLLHPELIKGGAL